MLVYRKNKGYASYSHNLGWLEGQLDRNKKKVISR